jgi:hypothetical protein
VRYQPLSIVAYYGCAKKRAAGPLARLNPVPQVLAQRADLW